MKHLLKLISVIMVSGLAFASCSKANNQTPLPTNVKQSLTLTFGDTAKTFTACVASAPIVSTHETETFIEAIDTTATGAQLGSSSFSIVLDYTSPLAAGQTYTAAELNTNNQTVGAEFNYHDASAEIYTPGEIGVNPDCSVTLISVTSTAITGTFSGILYSIGGKDFAVQNGKFTAAISKATSIN